MGTTTSRQTVRGPPATQEDVNEFAEAWLSADRDLILNNVRLYGKRVNRDQLQLQEIPRDINLIEVKNLADSVTWRGRKFTVDQAIEIFEIVTGQEFDRESFFDPVFRTQNRQLQASQRNNRRINGNGESFFDLITKEDSLPRANGTNFLDNLLDNTDIYIYISPADVTTLVNLLFLIALCSQKLHF